MLSRLLSARVCPICKVEGDQTVMHHVLMQHKDKTPVDFGPEALMERLKRADIGFVYVFWNFYDRI